MSGVPGVTASRATAQHPSHSKHNFVRKNIFSDQFLLSLVVSFIELISVERFPSTAL